MSQLKCYGRTKRGEAFFLSLLFSVALKGLNEAQPHWGGPSALLSPLIQVRSHLETPSQISPEITFHLGTLGPKLTHEMNHQTTSCCIILSAHP